MPKPGSSRDCRASGPVGPGRFEPMSIATREVRIPRDLHPGAWWIWALGMATAASRTTNPLVLAVVISVVVFVVSARRSDAPWANGFGAYLIIAAVVISIRVLFRMLLDGQTGEHILFTLPELSLPESAAGLRIGGPVSLEGILSALYDGLRLATLLICLGSANVLANPKRLLKSVPSALYEIGSAVTVALTIAPQLIESTTRITRARRLRGDVGRRTRWFSQVVIPVMTDALDRSLHLAAAMDSRGYGSTMQVAPGQRRLTGALVIGGMGGICIGVYGLLDASSPPLFGVPALTIGLVLAVVGFVASGSKVRRTSYRPDSWRVPEVAVALSGVAVAVVMFIVARSNPESLHPSTQPLVWPQLPVVATLGVLLGVVPAWVAPPVRRSSL